MSSGVMTDYKVRSIRRVCRKMVRCDMDASSRCARWIKTGDVYLSQTIFPGHDAISSKVPVRYRTCAPCAQHYGHDHLLDPLPIEQLYGQGLA